MNRRIFIYGLVAGIVALGLAAVTPAVAQAPFDPPGFYRAIAAQEANTDWLLEIEGVVGTGVGVDARGQAAVVVMTEDLGVPGLPRQLDGVSVVVKVTGRIQAVKKPGGTPGGGHGGDTGGSTIDPTSRFDRPVPIGVSTGNYNSCSAGTIGARVTDGTNVYALSNNHVYALEATTNTADRIGDEIDQPGVYDTNCAQVSNNQIGTLSAYVPLDFNGDNEVDAAVALSDKGSLGNGTPSDGYGVPSSTPVPADGDLLNLAVQKYGRTTGLTTGTVSIVNATVNVGYSAGTARFVNQIVVEGDKGGFLNAGDSGSLLVKVNNSPGASPASVGLLFASGRGGKIAIANPIDAVLLQLGGLLNQTLYIDDTTP